MVGVQVELLGHCFPLPPIVHGIWGTGFGVEMHNPLHGAVGVQKELVGH